MTLLGNLNLAVIGCGAIADSYYFPVLGKDAATRDKVWLVEPSQHETREGGARISASGSDQLVGDIADLPDQRHGRRQRDAQPSACRDDPAADRARRQRHRREAARRDSRGRAGNWWRQRGPLRADGQPLSALLPVLCTCARDDPRAAISATSTAHQAGRRARNSSGRRQSGFYFRPAVEGRPPARRAARHRHACARHGVMVAGRRAAGLSVGDGRVRRAGMFRTGRAGVRRYTARPRGQLSLETGQRLSGRGNEGCAPRLGDRLRHDRDTPGHRRVADAARAGQGRLDGLRRKAARQFRGGGRRPRGAARSTPRAWSRRWPGSMRSMRRRKVRCPATTGSGRHDEARGSDYRRRRVHRRLGCRGAASGGLGCAGPASAAGRVPRALPGSRWKSSSAT